jgi:hypothetical protein
MLFLAKMLQKSNVIVNRLEGRKAWPLCGGVYKSEDIVKNVVASTVLLEVEGLSKAHRPL